MSSQSRGAEPQLGSHEQQLLTLQELTAQLARITSSSEVASFVLSEGVTRLGGASGSLCLVVDGELEITASHGYSGDVIGAYSRFPIDAATPAGECAATRRPVYCQSIEELYDRYPIFRNGPIVGDPSVAVLPLEASDSTLLGTMVIGFSEPQQFHSAKRDLLEAIAAEAAVALDRARANEALIEARALAEEARDQLAFVAEASTKLAASLDLDETMRQVASLAVPRIADRCALYIADDAGGLQRFVLAPVLNADEQMLFDSSTPSLEDRDGVGAVIRTGRAVFVRRVDDRLIEAAAQSDEHLAILRRVGIGGIFLVPLPVRAKRVGALAFVNRAGRDFAEDERLLAQELAARAAVAIDNAQLFARELRIAETLQRALLPARLPDIPGVRLASRYVTGADQVHVGGDWYSAIAVDDERFALVVGDVSGRGLHAATTMASVRYTVRALAFEGYSPAAVLEKCGAQLDLEGGRFATVLVGLVDMARRELTLASAGHLNPLLISENGAEFLGAEPGLPIGIRKDATYGSTTVAIPPRAILLAYTDGLIERRGESIDAGMRRLRERALANHGDIQNMVSRLLEALTPAGPSDDVAVLGVQWDD